MNNESQPRKADAATQQIAREAAKKAALNLYQHGWVKPISRDLVEAYLLDDFLSAIGRAFKAQADETKECIAMVGGLSAQPQPSKSSPASGSVCPMCLTEHPRAGDHACEYPNEHEASRCKHCGLTSGEAIKYFESLAKARKEQAPRAQGSPASGERSEPQRKEPYSWITNPPPSPRR